MGKLEIRAFFVGSYSWLRMLSTSAFQAGNTGSTPVLTTKSTWRIPEWSCQISRGYMGGLQRNPGREIYGVNFGRLVA